MDQNNVKDQPQNPSNSDLQSKSNINKIAYDLKSKSQVPKSILNHDLKYLISHPAHHW